MIVQVTAPLKGFTGKVVGISFTGGTAEVDTSTDHGRAAYAYFDRHGYRLDRPAPDEPETPPAGDEPFDSAEHSVDDVLAHLDAASYEEAVRVLDAEVAGKNRVTITGKRDALLATKTPTEGDTQTGDEQ
ncbi:hypothetical protein ACWERV_17070 [Streptomyces sp. NPDC004031]